MITLDVVVCGVDEFYCVLLTSVSIITVHLNKMEGCPFMPVFSWLFKDRFTVAWFSCAPKS